MEAVAQTKHLLSFMTTEGSVGNTQGQRAKLPLRNITLPLISLRGGAKNAPIISSNNNDNVYHQADVTETFRVKPTALSSHSSQSLSHDSTRKHVDSVK